MLQGEVVRQMEKVLTNVVSPSRQLEAGSFRGRLDLPRHVALDDFSHLLP